MKRNVAVQIAGQRYVLKADDDDEQVAELAKYVDARIREIQKATRAADTQALAVLAALQIAQELFAERRAGKDLRKRVRAKSEALLEYLEREARV
jgi:cell division protein ZapA (FtsZ GTPase activity inhibitor)